MFAQLAISAYACPRMSPVATMQAQMAAEASSLVSTGVSMAVSGQPPSGCEGMAVSMDPDFANLCAEHCRHGQQSDQSASLTVPAALLTALYTTPLAPVPAVMSRLTADTNSALAAASPPLAILHCCFRI